MSEKKQVTVLLTEMEDLKIRSILDTGFFHEFTMAPEIHSHAYYELLFALNEGFRVELPDRGSVNVESGGCCLIPPGVYHATGQIDTESRKLAIRFEYMHSDEEAPKMSLYKEWDKVMAHQHSVVLLEKNEELSRALIAIYDEMTRSGIGHQAYMQALFSQIYLLLLRSLYGQCVEQTADKRHSAAETDIRALKIEEYLYAHFSESITEERLAGELMLSSRQLDRVLQKTYKKSFRKLLVEIRLNRAVQFLIETDDTVEEIAERVGYTSLSGFYSAFQRMFDCSPNKFRKKIGKS